MKIAIFFTYDYSIETLNKSGLLERELRIYRRLSEIYNIDFILLTYDEELEPTIKEFSEFEFIPIYKNFKKSNNKVVRFIKSFIIPFKIKAILEGVDLLYQHQLLGMWIPLILKIVLKKPLQVRTGYDAYLFSIENNDSFYKSLFYKYLTKLALKFSDLYTVTSECDRKFLSEKFSANHIKVVPNWVDLNKNMTSNKDKNKVLMVGRLENQKNYPLAFDFLKIVGSSLALDIYGSGSKYSNLKTLSVEENLKVNFFGNTSHVNLMHEFANYNYFLTTSAFEGNPKTVLEALSNQCIVFASNIPNHKELIKDGINGFLFSDVNELVDKFNFIKNNPSECEQIRLNCLTSLNNNEIANVAKLMYEDYRSLVSFK
tara:strand:- start:36689 stop:37804 length:1116 start_codon:yes stop_codon:yes gene_type:complete